MNEEFCHKCCQDLHPGEEHDCQISDEQYLEEARGEDRFERERGE